MRVYGYGWVRLGHGLGKEGRPRVDRESRHRWVVKFSVDWRAESDTRYNYRGSVLDVERGQLQWIFLCVLAWTGCCHQATRASVAQSKSSDAAAAPAKLLRGRAGTAPPVALVVLSELDAVGEAAAAPMGATLVMSVRLWTISVCRVEGCRCTQRERSALTVGRLATRRSGRKKAG